MVYEYQQLIKILQPLGKKLHLMFSIGKDQIRGAYTHKEIIEIVYQNELQQFASYSFHDMNYPWEMMLADCVVACAAGFNTQVAEKEIPCIIYDPAMPDMTRGNKNRVASKQGLGIPGPDPQRHAGQVQGGCSIGADNGMLCSCQLLISNLWRKVKYGLRKHMSYFCVDKRFAGPLWENHVITQWKKWNEWQQPSSSLWYWRDQTGNEVDLLIEQNNVLTAVECKVSERPSPRDTRRIYRLIDFYGKENIKNCFIACTTEQPFQVTPEVTACSGWTVWEL